MPPCLQALKSQIAAMFHDVGCSVF
jgi:hypothetical protein